MIFRRGRRDGRSRSGLRHVRVFRFVLVFPTHDPDARTSNQHRCDNQRDPLPDQQANIARLDPFTDSFEDIFRRVFRPTRWEGEDQPLQIKVDVEEDDKSYQVKAEVPGVKKEDINVQIDRNQVSISAESKREKDGQPKRFSFRKAPGLK